jgi:hypothetical protein
VVPASPRHSFGSAPHHSAAPSFAPPSLPPARHPSAAAAASAPLPSHSGGVAPARPAFHPGVGAGGGARGHFGRGR